MLVGAQGRNRTTDTRIFSPLLYQLSYLGRKDTQREGRVLNPRAPGASSNVKGRTLSGPQSGHWCRFERRVPTPRDDQKQSAHRWPEAAPV